MSTSAAAAPSAAPATQPAAPRAIPTPAQRQAMLVAANVKAKNQFAEKYEGAVIKLNTVLHNRSVIRAFKRIFAISLRNWYIATTVPRSALGDSMMASQVEQAMLRKIGEAVKFFEQKISQCEAVAADASVDFSLIGHASEFVDDTRVIGPVSMQLRSLFLKADRFLDLTQALYSFGQADIDSANNASYEVKVRLDAVSTSIRNHRVMALQKVNQSGKARDGFKPVPVDGESAGEVSAPQTAASNVLPITPAIPAAATETEAEAAA